ARACSRSNLFTASSVWLLANASSTPPVADEVARRIRDLMQPTLGRVAIGLCFGSMDGVRLTLIARLIETGAAQAMREAAGLSRAEAGASAKVHPITIFRWEHGERRPHGEAALRYLDLLEVLSR